MTLKTPLEGHLPRYLSNVRDKNDLKVNEKFTNHALFWHDTLGT
jgi:hypothetical protein